MQTSKKPSTLSDAQLWEQFYSLLCDLANPAEMDSFLSSFLTPTERVVFAKRLHVAWLLQQGKSYGEIAKQLNVSSATISSVAMSKDTEGMQLALQKVQLDHKATSTLRSLTFWKR